VLALELGTGIGEIVYWYESLSNERGYSTKVKDISIKKYKGRSAYLFLVIPRQWQF